LVFGPELITQTVVSKGSVLARNNAPIELLLGAHYTWPIGVRAGAGFGMGLSSSFRAPQHRGLVSVEWTPGYQERTTPPIFVVAAPLPDRDNDGVLNAADECPADPGEARYNGCPAPSDRDGDGVSDLDDQCPDRAGDAAHQGCPPPDRDRDKVLDAQDACPDTAGVPHEDPAKNGCPGPVDSDGDGILDEHDACPRAAGPGDPDPKRTGCPKAFVEGDQIRILDQVKFQTGKAKIVQGKDSEDVLMAVLQVLNDHPEIAQVRIEGHTDNKGDAAYNRTLSQQRAQAVVDWLVKHGIVGSRLASQGFGPDRPIASNDIEEGRQQNRRVEFHIQ
jgi:OmpA-OmpF porin, OOP family